MSNSRQSFSLSRDGFIFTLLDDVFALYIGVNKFCGNEFWTVKAFRRRQRQNVFTIKYFHFSIFSFKEQIMNLFLEWRQMFCFRYILNGPKGFWCWQWNSENPWNSCLCSCLLLPNTILKSNFIVVAIT